MRREDSFNKANLKGKDVPWSFIYSVAKIQKWDHLKTPTQKIKNKIKLINS